MRTENIEKLIDRLNSGDFKDIFLYNISKEVAYGKVWYKKDNRHSDTNGIDWDYEIFYFIKDENEEYAAAVIVHKNIDDLHWFVKKAKRKKGILTKALKTTILPHLLSLKSEQRITIQADDKDSFEASRKVALNVGFTEISGAEFSITREDIQLKKIEIIRSGMNEEELKIILKKLRDISMQIRKIDDEFEFKLGVANEFRTLSNGIAAYSNDKLAEEYWRLKNKL